MNTWLDGLFWGPYFRRVYVAEILALRDTIFDRILPAFREISSEAETAQEDEWNRQMSMPSEGGDDPGDAGEMASEVGIAHYERLCRMRQMTLNMMAVNLRHLVDQQIMDFHKRQVLSISEERERTLHKDIVFRDRLRNAGIDVETLRSWISMVELRLLSNVIKHGEGDFKPERQTDYDKLFVTCPELFVEPEIRGTESQLCGRPRVDRPAGGEDLYVSETDLSRYIESSVMFWNELAEIVEFHSSAQKGQAVP
jgi:hypothetical protein